MPFDDNTGIWYDDQGRPHITVAPNAPIGPNQSGNQLPIDISDLQDYAATLPVQQPNPLPTHETYVPTLGQKVIAGLTTGNPLVTGDVLGRTQTFPEKIVRSALSLPTDVMSGNVQTPFTDPYAKGAITDPSGEVKSEGGLLSRFGVKPVGGNEPEDELLQRVQDMAALMGGGGVGMAEKGALGSAIFDPSKHVKSSLTNTLMSDTTKPGMALAALEKAPTFYSAVENAVNTASMKSAPAQQWLSTIKQSKGVKPEELNWTGLEDYLKDQKGPISKEQVQEYLQSNKVNVEKNTLYQEWWRELHRAEEDTTKYSKWQLPGGENYKETLLTLPRKEQSVSNIARYLSSFDRKVLDEIKTPQDLLQAKQFNPQLRETLKGVSDDQAISEIADAKAVQDEGDAFKSTHWDEPNIIAHIRQNSRNVVGENGQNDIRSSSHIEEIQSDWHQKGRESGYKITDKQKAELESIDKKLTDGLSEADIGNPDINQVLKTAIDKKIVTQEEASKFKEYTKGENSNIPDAPFKKTWLDLALKHVIRDAAEKGLDRISWTPGEAQAARYDLSKQVNSIHVMSRTDARTGEKTRSALIDLPGGQLMSLGINKEGIIDNVGASNMEMKGKQLSDVVGKEIAEKIMNMNTEPPPRPTELPEGYHTIIDRSKGDEKWGVIPPGQVHAKSLVGWHPTEEEATRQAINHIHAEMARDTGVLKNIDLKVGGEGMHYFYDVMVPKALEKLTGEKMKVGNVPELKSVSNTVFERGKPLEVVKVGNEWHIKYENGETLGSWISKEDATNSMNAQRETLAKGQPMRKVNYIDLPQSVKDTALHRGFPLFSSGMMLSPSENPFVNNNQDVPYGAGASNTKSGYPVNIDKRIPQFDDRLKLPNGQPADLHKYLSVHEIEEHKAMQKGVPYEKAHLNIATPAERKAVEADGVNWGEYEKIVDGYLAQTEHEKPLDPPANLYKDPYPHKKQILLEKNAAKYKLVPVEHDPFQVQK